MQSLELRLTHGYVGTWQHLDKWQHIGSFDEIGRRQLPLTEEEEDDICEPRRYEVFVVVDRTEQGATQDQIKQALCDIHTQWGCDHEYDCCGCRSYSASEVTNLGGPVWRILISSSRNY